MLIGLKWGDSMYLRVTYIADIDGVTILHRVVKKNDLVNFQQNVESKFNQIFDLLNKNNESKEV